MIDTKNPLNLWAQTAAVGFEEVFNRMNSLAKDYKAFPAYPPYNIVKTDENKYTVEVALAGFSKTDIDIEIKDNTLVISGKTTSEDPEKYIYKGIADRAFKRSFELADTVEVMSSQRMNGMLKIYLENIIPESKKPRKLEIKDKDED